MSGSEPSFRSTFSSENTISSRKKGPHQVQVKEETIEEERVEVPPPAQGARMYYADWLRVIAVHSVIFVHCLNNAADTVELKDRDAMEKKEGICKILS